MEQEHFRNTEILTDFDTVLHAFIDFGAIAEGTAIPPELKYIHNAEGLGKKIVRHSVSARVLANGYIFTRFEEIIDFSSIAVLVRSAFETYLTFHYLFIDPIPEAERECRITAWYIGGLDRTKFAPAYEAHKEKYEQEVQQKETHKKELKENSYFQTLVIKVQKKILKGKWLVKQWHEMATSAGFSESYFRQQYMFLSSYAHSNRLSSIQIQQLKSLHSQQNMAGAFIAILTPVLAKYAYDYAHLIPELNGKIDWTTPSNRMVLMYKDIAERISSESVSNTHVS